MCALPNRLQTGPRSPVRRPNARTRDGTWRAKAGDPPEHAQDNPPPYPGGSTFPQINGEVATAQRALAGGGIQLALSLIPPGLIVAVLLVLIVSQLFFAFLPYRHRAYIP